MDYSMYIQTSDYKKLERDFDVLVNKMIDKNGIFVTIKPNVFRFKKYQVQKMNDGWVVTFNKKGRIITIGTTFLKISAFAVCKLHDKQWLRQVAIVLENDEIYKKNSIDAGFFKNVVDNSKDFDKKSIAECRFDITSNKAKRAKKLIKNYFISTID